MINPNQKLPLTESELRKTITRILDRTVDVHQLITQAATQFEALDIEIRNLRILCLKTLPPEPSVAESIIPGLNAVYSAIDSACERAKTPNGCAEVAKAAVFNSIWHRVTQLS